MSGDVLSDLLRTVRLTGAAYFNVVGREPWVAEQPARELVLPKVLPGAEHLIAYHVVTEGRCYAGIVGGEPVAVEAGEVVVFTQGDPHVMSSSPGMRAEPVTSGALDAIAAGPLPYFVNYGDGAVSTKLVCGFLACDARPFNPLLESLPPVIKASTAHTSEAGWLGQFISVAVMETAAKRAGSESVLSKLSELMFIEVVRRHLEGLPAEQAGWLAGLRDPFIGKALSLLHARPAYNWTIEELAREVGQSRSVLAERFAFLVGTPPLHYLAKWRMQIASESLSAGTANVARIAADIGYESEAAFSRAFKKIIGVPPSVWRRRVRLNA
ncbi:MAG TPA: AraC family transcriptional regulator [Pseudolabrys sp.]|nr:AraC family transcriptional regulator [Pseudolabrys sp.]